MILYLHIYKETGNWALNMCVLGGNTWALWLWIPDSLPHWQHRGSERPCERLSYSFRALRIDCTTSVTHNNFPQASHERRRESARACACAARLHSMSLRWWRMPGFPSTSHTLSAPFQRERSSITTTVTCFKAGHVMSVGDITKLCVSDGNCDVWCFDCNWQLDFD